MRLTGLASELSRVIRGSVDMVVVPPMSTSGIDNKQTILKNKVIWSVRYDPDFINTNARTTFVNFIM